MFSLYDKEQTGVIEFEQLKHIARSLGEYLTDDDLLDLMHAVFIKHQTTSNESISFEEFYGVISAYYNRKDLPKPVWNLFDDASFIYLIYNDFFGKNKKRNAKLLRAKNYIKNHWPDIRFR